MTSPGPEKDCPTDPIGIPALRLVPGTDDRPALPPAPEGETGETKEKNKKGKGKKKHAKNKGKKSKKKGKNKKAPTEEVEPPQVRKVLLRTLIFGARGQQRPNWFARRMTRKSAEIVKLQRRDKWLLGTVIGAPLAAIALISLIGGLVQDAANDEHNRLFLACKGTPADCGNKAHIAVSWMMSTYHWTVALGIVWLICLAFAVRAVKSKLPVKVGDWVYKWNKPLLVAFGLLSVVELILMIVTMTIAF